MKAYLLKALSFLVLCATPITHVNAATINIITNDQIDEGFNDPSPFTPVGGNSATTLGQARLNAFRYATSIIEKTLPYTAEVTIHANMDPLGGSANSAILASAGARSMVFNFNNAPKTNTLYPVALANYLFGQDINPNTSDIITLINSDIDSTSILQNSRWYYGLDGNPPNHHPDFVTVLTHELLHGLGFSNHVNLVTGEMPFSKEDVYSNHLAIDNDNIQTIYTDATNNQRAISHITPDTLLWNGEKTNLAALSKLSSGIKNLKVKMYTPSQLEHPSSVSHFATDLFPDETMEPFYTGPNHSLGLAAHALSDMGWGKLADLDINAIRTRETESSELQHNFRITVTNSDYDSASEVIISLPLNSGINVENYQSEHGECSITSNIYICKLGDIHTGGQKTLYLAIINKHLEDTNLAFSVSANNVDPMITNNTSTHTLQNTSAGGKFNHTLLCLLVIALIARRAYKSGI
ncbi:MAG: Unknown protein [uncultured Thiotrichaceae bacterium]|uniref:DUF11 domain-containing protein n=1 Tax=uncultured Thiotrichaceae bacterium TaxID=298394 RepID=A0A6S6UHC2_9GAMM|nr:MAG: Unknown protein [uncultured Thiotrichaceae bacterium]